MKLKLTSALLTATLGLLLLAADSRAEHLIRKRQAARPRPTINIQVDSADSSPSAGQAASAAAMSSMGPPNAVAQASPINPMGPPAQPGPQGSQGGVGNASNLGPDYPPSDYGYNRRPRPPPPEDSEEPERRRPARRRRPTRRPDYNNNRRRPESARDEDCEEDDYDYQDMFAPMRQIGRIMNNVFGHMQSGMPYGEEDGDEGPMRGGNLASASAFSSSGGDSRVSSFVSNNGRSRGVVSETRDGRTKTRRYGMGRDDDEAEEEES